MELCCCHVKGGQTADVRSTDDARNRHPHSTSFAKMFDGRKQPIAGALHSSAHWLACFGFCSGRFWKINFSAGFFDGSHVFDDDKLSQSEFLKETISGRVLTIM